MATAGWSARRWRRPVASPWTRLAEIFDRGSGVAQAPARERLVEVAEFYRVARRAMDEALETWRAGRM